MVFATTVIVNGHGTAIVTETSMNTKVGHIANMIITNEAPQTPLQKKLADVGKVLGVVCLSICALIFVIGLIKKISPIEMFMTSVRTCGCSNSRRITCYCNYNVITWSY